MRESDDELLTAIGIPADSSVGIDDYCARRGWRITRSSRATPHAPVHAHCVTIRGVRNDDWTRADVAAELGHACVEPADRTSAAQQAAMTQAARRALGQALAVQGF